VRLTHTRGDSFRLSEQCAGGVLFFVGHTPCPDVCPSTVGEMRRLFEHGGVEASMDIIYHPIGIIHTPFKELEGMPIQPTAERSAPGLIEILPAYLEALQDLDGFSHLILIYHLHRVQRADLTVTPFLDSQPRGVFATRAPTRPNPIGLSVVALERIEGQRLYLGAVDILDGTPLLDIKPFVPEFDQPHHARIGWLEGAQGAARSAQSDSLFTRPQAPESGRAASPRG
jgi:tRNA-Thr(GGU) m(6)t(6)A37 methyltransferase TsaA